MLPLALLTLLVHTASCQPFKGTEFAKTLASNSVAWRIGAVSDRYPLEATPSDDTFGIWGLIYTGLAREVWVPPWRDAEFAESMRLNTQWLGEWTAEDLVAANRTIHRLRAVNIRLADRARDADWLTRYTYDVYSTWVKAASLLGEWVVRVYVDNQPDESMAAVKALLRDLGCGERPSRGVMDTVKRALKGLRLDLDELCAGRPFSEDLY